MGSVEPDKSRGLAVSARRVVYWVLPIVILAVILTRIDLRVLAETVRNANVWLYLAGVVFFPATMVIGASRWKVLLKQYLGETETFGYLFRHYCIGLSVSIFLPGQIGMDIYRVAVASRRFRQYTANIAVVLEEKFLTLVVCIGLVLGITPWLRVQNDASVLESITDVASAILVGGGLTLLMLFLLARVAAARRVAAFLRDRLQSVFASMLARLGVDTSRFGPLPPLAEVFAPIGRPSNLLPVILLSIALFGALGVGNQFFLAALGYDLPFVASLFVVAVLFFAVSLPISFAGFGVREGAYILLLGMFDVPAESALVVSFFALSGVLVNYGIGGISIFASRKDTEALVSKAR